MQFGILGPLEVHAPDGETVAVGGPRPRALLVLLALHAGHLVSAEHLIDGQYGDDPPAGAANAIQAQVSRLRRALPTDVIEFRGAGYRLAVDPDDVDAHRFERLAAAGRALLADGRHDAAERVLTEALDLWRGPALADLPAGGGEAARLEELRLAATEDLAGARLALPDASPVAELRRLLAAHPLRERAAAQLVRALHAAGRRADALAEYDRIRRLLADELGADPSPELAAAHLAVLRAEEPAPARRVRPAAQITSFVGRTADLDRLAAGDARLRTIVGPGGAGKTRLAIEYAATAGREACFVDLSALDDGDQVPGAALRAVGVRESGLTTAGDTDPTRRLVAALSGEDLLLVLDNCEQVVAAVAELTRTLLAECPGLVVVATSREALGITGELLVPLAPLPIPAPDVAAPEALDWPAVRLFADRAAAVRPGFAVTPETVAAVVGICATLDGLPLAVELAAARLRQFGVDEIAARLAGDGRFRLLSRGDRTAAARHRTLRAVVEWSWELLDGAEQALARRFAVFAGGAPTAAVEAVCGPGDTDELLAALVDKSLVETDGGRYRMLDTIRTFAAERLTESGESDAVRRAHAAYHLDLARRADPELRRGGQLGWLARLGDEHGNLMAALRWSVGADRPTAYGLIAALAAYVWLSGRRSQVGDAAAELLRDPPDEFAEEHVACVVYATPRAAPELWERGARVLWDPQRPLRYPFIAALWGMSFGPPDAAAERSDPALLLRDDPWNVALAGLSNALMAMLGGRPAEGELAMSTVLAQFRALGERWGTSQALDWLAYGCSCRGDWAGAHRRWSASLEALGALGALEESAEVLCRRASCRLRQDDPDGAEADLVRAAELTARAGQPDTPLPVLLGLAEVAWRRGDSAATGERLARAGAATGTEGFGTEPARVRLRTQLGRLAAALGDTDAAREHHRAALRVARSSPLATTLADAADGQADAALLDRAGDRAALLLGAAVALRGTAVAGDADVAATAERATELVGADRFAAGYARGAAMSREEALTALDGPAD